MAASFSALDHAHMARALRLAERGLFSTRPNPMVGCVIARGETVLGEGWHQRAGGPHAEVFALREAGEDARGATAYVTLEPCAHHGRTPPCAEALVAAGVARVVAACRDPFPQVDGQGLERLREAGIAVESGLLENAARELNRGFFSRIERGRPWLRIKLGMSLDGRTALASGESKWITGAEARRDVQRWRARAGALLTGMGTVLADDPRLTLRAEEGAPPDALPLLRVVLDSRGRLAPDRRLASDGEAPTLRLHREGLSVAALPGVEDVPGPASDEGLDLAAVAAELGQRGLNEVQVEAGPSLCGALLRAGLVDELLLYQAPMLLGDRGRPLFAGLDLQRMEDRFALELLETRAVGRDLRLRLRPRTMPG
jgi:diaminohydroxyphosphoribosylaminopyrimidine deaminase / 5-amino-6-(5-phosphoribosylamino)uracil reductase